MRRKRTLDELLGHVLLEYPCDYFILLVAMYLGSWIFQGKRMKQKAALLAAILAVVVASAATAFAVEEQQADTKAGQAEAVKAGKSKAKKPLKKDSHIAEKTITPKVRLLRDWEELFGHKPMEEHNRMPMPEPASGAGQQETMKPMQKHDHMQEKH